MNKLKSSINLLGYDLLGLEYVVYIFSNTPPSCSGGSCDGGCSGGCAPGAASLKKK